MSRRRPDPRESLNRTVTTHQLRDVFCTVGDKLLKTSHNNSREMAAEYISALFARLYSADKAILSHLEPVTTSAGTKLTWQDVVPSDEPCGSLRVEDFLKTTRKEVLFDTEGGHLSYTPAPLYDYERLKQRSDRNLAMDTIDLWVAQTLAQPPTSETSDGR